jgi:hypothetical protein
MRLQDLSQLVEDIKARGTTSGLASIDPQILFALRLYATTKQASKRLQKCSFDF